MSLREWLTQGAMQQKELAAALRCSPGLITRILEGRSLSRKKVVAIHNLTGGDVCPNDLFRLGPQHSKSIGSSLHGQPLTTKFVPLRDSETSAPQIILRLAIELIEHCLSSKESSGLVVHVRTLSSSDGARNAKAEGIIADQTV